MRSPSRAPPSRWLFFACVAALAAWGARLANAEEAFCGGATEYSTDAARRPGALNVHLIPHTHDDAGWLKNIDQYFHGDAQYIQPAGVVYELDSILTSLEADPARRFVYSDVGFFSMWWGEQGPSVRERTRALVKEGRLSFVNGGWVQHDEACPTWEAMVDQLTRGHRWLNGTFGPASLPSVSWQIDPFGHSATHAALVGAAGFDALYFARADFADVVRRAARREMELVWRGEPSYGASADVFTGNFIQGNYSAPWGFSFDWLQADPPIIDNTCAAPGVNNVQERVDLFVRAVTELSKPVLGADVAAGGDIMLTMGADFQYAAAPVYFKNLDKLIHHVNADGRVNAFYSTPAAYTAAKHAGVPAWPLKTDDFFPFANDKDSYWTGYFTSRPGLKKAIAGGSGELAALRQLAVLGRGQQTRQQRAVWEGALDALESAVAFGAHHDTITGTSKQHVTNAYLARLAAAGAGVEPLAGAALASRAGVAVAGAQPPVEWCRALNASVCAPSARASAAGRPFTVLLYNSLASSPRSEGVRLPVRLSPSSTWAVTGPGGEAIPSQLLPVSTGGRTAAASLVAAGGAAADDAPAHEIAFLATLPPLGAAAFTVTPVAPGSPGAAAASEPVGEAWSGRKGATAPGLGRPDALLTLAPSSLAPSLPDSASATLTLDAGTGALVGVSSASSGANDRLTLTGFDLAMGYYKSADDNGKGIAGGAYIMRTNDSPLYTGFDLDREAGREPPATPARSASAGPVLATYSVSFAPYASATIRLWAGLANAEVEWTVGPLPSADRVGREMVVSYSAGGLLGGGEGNTTFWTDANGRRNLRRVRNARPTFVPSTEQATAGNFYPVTSLASLEQGGGGLALAAVTDRTQAAASRGAGIDFLVHRRLFKDDWKGVAEPLNETACGCVPAWSTAGSVGFSDCQCGGVVATGTHTLVVAPAGPDGAQARRDAQARAGRPLLVGVVDGAVALVPAASSGLVAPLPSNVRLTTLAPAGRPGAEDGRVLLRLAHAYGVGEHPTLSAPATVDLNALVAGMKWAEVTEVALTGARPLGGGSAPEKLAWRVGEALDLGGAKAKAAAGAVRPGAAAAVPAQPLGCADGCAAKALPVTLGPMQIRTFLVTPAAGE